MVACVLAKAIKAAEMAIFAISFMMGPFITLPLMSGAQPLWSRR
jgi:hypothetical protein